MTEEVMIHPQKTNQAFQAIHNLLVNARSLAYDLGDGLLASMLDEAEILPKYFVSKQDDTSQFASGLEQIARRIPEAESAVKRLLECHLTDDLLVQDLMMKTEYRSLALGVLADVMDAIGEKARQRGAVGIAALLDSGSSLPRYIADEVDRTTDFRTAVERISRKCERGIPLVDVFDLPCSQEW